MAYNQLLADKLREALAHLPNVEEKEMFRGVTFMVNDKMCISVSGDELMCRIDPALHDDLVQKPGCRPMEMKGRTYIGYVYVAQEAWNTEKELAYWIGLCLEFNTKAKSSKKKNKKEGHSN